jgi:hypothetical protein
MHAEYKGLTGPGKTQPLVQFVVLQAVDSMRDKFAKRAIYSVS